MYVPHVLFSFRCDLGPSGAPVEEASFGLRFGQPGVGNPPALTVTQAQCDAALAALKVFIASTAMFFTTQVRTREVRAYVVGADGRITTTPKISSGTPVAGITSTGVPFQVSQVVTLQATGLGKGRLGRVYLPPTYVPVSVDGTINAGTATAQLAAFKTFVTSLRNDSRPAVSEALIIASQTGGIGMNRGVSTLKMGRVYDTQRRRRRSLDEGYQLTPLDTLGG